jgi:CMP/dCMP kinase
VIRYKWRRFAPGVQAIRIAIDGPSASGKSAAGSRVAARLGYPFVDTGSMYRAVTWLALRAGVDPADRARLGALAEAAALRIGPPPADGREACSIVANGEDVTRFLRDAAVERAVSPVSAVPAVRRALVRLQREAAPADVVMAGRDIGTVVLADADLKIYLDATIDVRAARRQAELAQKGRVESLEQVRADLARRDEIDSGRAHSPLRAAADAIRIDSDALSLDEVVERIVRIAVERGAVEGQPAR